MQFQEFLYVNKVDRRKFICASCVGKNHKCLKPGIGNPDGVEIESLLIDESGARIRRRVNAESIYQYIDEVQASGIDADELNICFLSHGSDVCPIPLIDMETFTVKDMIDLCDRMSAQEYLDSMAVYTEAMKIVKSEENRLIPLRPFNV